MGELMATCSVVEPPSESPTSELSGASSVSTSSEAVSVTGGVQLIFTDSASRSAAAAAGTRMLTACWSSVPGTVQAFCGLLPTGMVPVHVTVADRPATVGAVRVEPDGVDAVATLIAAPPSSAAAASRASGRDGMGAPRRLGVRRGEDSPQTGRLLPAGLLPAQPRERLLQDGLAVRLVAALPHVGQVRLVGLRLRRGRRSLL